MQQYDVIMTLNNVIVSIKLSLDVILCNFGYLIKRGFEVIENGDGRLLQAKKKSLVWIELQVLSSSKPLYSVPDPDLEITGGGEAGRGRSSIIWDKVAGGGGGLQKFFRPFRPQFGLEIRGGRWAPRAPPPVSSTAIIPFCVSFFFLLCLFVFFSTSCINLATILWEAIPRWYYFLKGNMFLLMVSSAPRPGCFMLQKHLPIYASTSTLQLKALTHVHSFAVYRTVLFKQSLC